MFCGIRSFSCVHDDSWPTSPQPKRSKTKRTERRKNPYAANGLDKFEKLVAELKAKKKEIKMKKGSDDGTVRFRHDNGGGDWIPVVIRRGRAEEVKELELQKVVEVKKSERKVTRRRVECWVWVIVVVMLGLSFGRSFAICCATICWYMVPIIQTKNRENLNFFP